MKNFKKSFFMVIMIAMTIGFFKTSAIAQTLPAMQDPDFLKVQPDGRYHIGAVADITPYHLDLCTYNSTYTTVQSVDKLNIMYEAPYFFKRGQKHDFYHVLFIKDTDTATANSLKIRRNLNTLSGGGNFLISQNANGTGWSKRLSANYKENDAAYDTINTHDGTWFPAYGGQFIGNGVCKISKITIDSIPGDANNTYYTQYKVSFECLQYPLGTAPYKGLRCVQGAYSGNLLWDIDGGDFASKKVDGYFHNDVLRTGYVTGIDSTGFALNAKAFYSNFYDLLNSKWLHVDLYDSVTGTLVEPKSWSSYYDLVDENGTGQNRIDLKENWLYFFNLKDGHPYQLKLGESNGKNGSKNYIFTHNIRTLKKVAIVIDPVKTDPVLNTVTVSDLDSTSAKLNLDITTGNNPGTATVTVKVTVLEDNIKVIYDGNIDIVGTQTPINITKTVPLTGLSTGTEHVYTVKLLTAEKIGSFTTLKSSSGGGSTVSITTISTNKASFYPNPTYDVIQITGKGTKEIVQITDLSGRVIKKSLETEIDMTSQSAGFYLVKIGDRNAQRLEKK